MRATCRLRTVGLRRRPAYAVLGAKGLEVVLPQDVDRQVDQARPERPALLQAADGRGEDADGFVADPILVLDDRGLHASRLDARLRFGTLVECDDLNFSGVAALLDSTQRDPRAVAP